MGLFPLFGAQGTHHPSRGDGRGAYCTPPCRCRGDHLPISGGNHWEGRMYVYAHNTHNGLNRPIVHFEHVRDPLPMARSGPQTPYLGHLGPIGPVVGRWTNVRTIRMTTWEYAVPPRALQVPCIPIGVLACYYYVVQ
jgi:hypothetical protein